MKEIKILIPDNKELKKVGDNYELVDIDTRIKSWKDIKELRGYYVNSDCEIVKTCSEATTNNKNMFITKEQAKKALAMAQLSQILKSLNDGWVADWSHYKEKYIISRMKDTLIRSFTRHQYEFLTFKDEETRDYFLSVPEFVQLARDYYEI